MNIIEVENISFSYFNEEAETKALRNFSLNIESGSFVAILGHNGCGKSTLAKMFNAVLEPQTGRVLVCGLDTKVEENGYEIRKNVGLVFQNPDNQIVATVVEEDVAFALENLGVPTDIMRERVDWALKCVGMEEYKTHAPHLLSGGQKQRVAIAGVIAMQPKCIVLDEPTAMLDPSGRKEVMSTITMLNKKLGITVILITHFMDEAVQADRVVVMDEGQLLVDGTPEYVFQNVALLKSVGLDVPQSTELMFSLREEDIKVPISVLTSDRCVEVLKDLLKR